MLQSYATLLFRAAGTAAVLLVALLLLTNEAEAQSSLYADPIAQQPGDILTVILSERTSAQRQSDYRDRSNSSLGGAGSINGGGLSGAFGLDAEIDRSSRAENQTLQSEMLSGTFSAQITDRDDVGNLLIQGERRMNVNGVTHIMRIEGTVRPFDVRFDNTIHSYQISNAQIEYRQAGIHRRLFRPGTLVRAGALALLGAATVIAATN